MKRWGADAIRDCDGTEFPEELTKTGFAFAHSLSFLVV